VHPDRAQQTDGIASGLSQCQGSWHIHHAMACLNTLFCIGIDSVRYAHGLAACEQRIIRRQNYFAEAEQHCKALHSTTYRILRRHISAFIFLKMTGRSKVKVIGVASYGALEHVLPSTSNCVDMCLPFCYFRFTMTQSHCRRRFTFHTRVYRPIALSLFIA